MVLNAIADRTTWLRKWLDTNCRDIDAEAGWPVTITMDDYKKAFKRGDLATRIIEIYPHESWKDSPDVYETEENEETPFEKAWKETAKANNLYAVLQRADVISGVGRYGLILIGVSDGKKLDQPVAGVEEALLAEFKASTTEETPAAVTPPATTKKPLKIIYLRTFDESVVTIKEVEKDMSNPRFGQPKMYSLKFQNPESLAQANGITETIDADVHWTRVLHVCDNRTDNDIFGTPRLERCYNCFLNLKKILGGAGEMMWRGGYPGISIETQPMQGDDVFEFDKEATEAQIEKYQKGFRRYLALLGMTAKSLQPNIADPTPHANLQIRMIAIAWGIPWRILMGSELGQLASEQDIENWNTRVGRRQNDYVAPYMVVPFANRLIAMGVLPPLAAGRLVLVAWKDTHTVTKKDKADVAEKITNAITKYVQGGGEMVIDLFHFLTLVCAFTEEEANSILDKVGDALAKDREMKQAMADLSMEETQSGIDAAANNGGRGNGNANGSTSTSRNTNANRAPQGAAA